MYQRVSYFASMDFNLQHFNLEDLKAIKLEKLVSLFVAKDPEKFASNLSAFNRKLMDDLPEDFQESYGWLLPKEVIQWRAIELALDTDNQANTYWRFDHQTLEMELYPETLFVDEEELENGFFLQRNTELLLAGLAGFSQDASGDRDLVSVLPDKNELLAVYYYNHETGKLGEKQSLKSYVLTNWTSEYDPEDYEDSRPGCAGWDGYKRLLGITKALDQEILTERPLFCDSKYLYHRSKWLQSPVWGKPGYSLEKDLQAAPTMNDWQKEFPFLSQHPVLLNYWMVAHYFLGNERSCREAVSIGKQSDAEVTAWISGYISRLLNKPDETFLGQIPAQQLARLRQKIREKTPAALLEEQ